MCMCVSIKHNINTPSCVSTQVEHWTVTEICREQDLAKRVALVKKFIKIAG